MAGYLPPVPSQHPFKRVTPGSWAAIAAGLLATASNNRLLNLHLTAKAAARGTKRRQRATAAKPAVAAENNQMRAAPAQPRVDAAQAPTLTTAEPVGAVKDEQDTAVQMSVTPLPGLLAWKDAAQKESVVALALAGSHRHRSSRAGPRQEGTPAYGRWCQSARRTTARLRAVAGCRDPGPRAVCPPPVRAAI